MCDSVIPLEPLKDIDFQRIDPPSLQEAHKIPHVVPTKLSTHMDHVRRFGEIRKLHRSKEHYELYLENLNNHSRVVLQDSQVTQAEFLSLYRGVQLTWREIQHADFSSIGVSLQNTPHGYLFVRSIPEEATINHDLFPYQEQASKARPSLPTLVNGNLFLNTLGWNAPPQMGMPDYEPHSGSLETCANLLDSYDKVVASPLYGQVISLLKWENPLLSTAALLATSLALFIIKTCVMTFNFLFGCLIGVIFINKPSPYKYSPQSGRLDNFKTFTKILSKASTIVSAILAVIVTLSKDQGKTVAYTPHSGITPDDGAKFLGKVVPKTGNVPDMPDSTPGVTAINSRHTQVLPRTAPPKNSKKDPNDGPLNGFGIGL
jgi:hypothetical protein